GRATALPHKERKTFGIEGIGGQPRNLLLLHGSAPLTPHATDLALHLHAGIATRQVADLSHLVIVKRPRPCTTHPAACFFPRRTKGKRRALGSPKTPRTVALGRNPANRYVSLSRRSVCMVQPCHVFPPCNTPQTLNQSHFPTSQRASFTHSIGRRSFIKDFKNALQADRLSCSSFAANFFRLLEHAAAYVLFHALRTQVAPFAPQP